MELRDIRYFQAVAENGSITKAAQELHIAQPTISRQMQVLEDELGVTLFLRGKRHIELTPAGAVFLKRISAVLLEINQTTREIKYFKDEIRGTLSIATNDSMGCSILAPLVRAFQKKYPLITYELYTAQAQRMTQLLRKSVVDVAFMMTPIDEEQFDYLPFLTTRLGAVMRRDREKGSEPDSIRLAELKSIPLILPNRYRSPICEGFWNRGFGDPQILCDSHSVSNDIAWVSSGIGVAISPSLCTKMPAFQSGDLIFKNLVDPELSYTNVLAWNKKTPPSHIASCFIEFLRENAQQLLTENGFTEDELVIAD